MHHMSINAKVIADSISPDGNRLTTLEVRFHRFILAEMNTHRMLSRNSASSRAIPLQKQINNLLSDTAIPVIWAAEQKGMQGGDEISDTGVAEGIWLEARDSAIAYANQLAGLGVHKSIVNRIIEPFVYHTAIISATEWDNFWTLRCSPLAQPEMRVAAEAMKDAYDASIPMELSYGQWHLPYVSSEEITTQLILSPDKRVDLKAVSAARCCRVSYLTHDGKRDISEDLALYQRLITASPPHASPLEHVSTPHSPKLSNQGNFIGWRQLRHEVLNGQ